MAAETHASATQVLPLQRLATARDAERAQAIARWRGTAPTTELGILVSERDRLKTVRGIVNAIAR